MIKRVIIPDILQPVSHYCHVVQSNGIVWVSGLVGMLPDNSVPVDTKKQFDIAMSDLGVCLSAVGSSAQEVVKVIDCYSH